MTPTYTSTYTRRQCTGVAHEHCRTSLLKYELIQHLRTLTYVYPYGTLNTEALSLGEDFLRLQHTLVRTYADGVRACYFAFIHNSTYIYRRHAGLPPEHCRTSLRMHALPTATYLATYADGGGACHPPVHYVVTLTACHTYADGVRACHRNTVGRRCVCTLWPRLRT